MSDDPLAAFRKQGAPPQPVAARSQIEARDAYRAFAGKDNQRSRSRLDIRCANGIAHAVSYNFIVEIAYDRRDYTGILIVLTTMVVKVKGRALRPIVDALKLGVCEFIEEFAADQFGPPEDPAGPFVDSIEVVSSAEQRENMRQE
jgi:hypothetical protein